MDAGVGTSAHNWKSYLLYHSTTYFAGKNNSKKLIELVKKVGWKYFRYIFVISYL